MHHTPAADHTAFYQVIPPQHDTAGLRSKLHVCMVWNIAPALAPLLAPARQSLHRSVCDRIGKTSIIPKMQSGNSGACYMLLKLLIDCC